MTDDGTYTYAYDALTRLIKVTRKSDSAVMGEYAYDALGRRIWRKADEDQSGSQETELYYVHDGNREIEERTYSDEDLKRDYVYGNYIDEPIFARADKNDDNDFADSGEQFYYCHNNLYNVTVLLDTSGNIIEAYEYKSYGKVTIYTSDGGDGDWFDGDETTGSLTGNYYLFTGRRYDPESGLYYFRNRFFSDYLGRFQTRDPSGRQFSPYTLIGTMSPIFAVTPYTDGMNLYCAYFVPNANDPMGTMSLYCIYLKLGIAEVTSELKVLYKVSDLISGGFPPGQTTGNPAYDFWLAVGSAGVATGIAIDEAILKSDYEQWNKYCVCK